MKVYPAHGHPEGQTGTPWFKIKGDKLYPDFGHPQGQTGTPWFSLHS